MTTQLEALKKLIKNQRIAEAILYLKDNREALKEAIKNDAFILYLVTLKWVKGNHHVDEPASSSLWKMETYKFNSYIPLPLPRKFLEEILELDPFHQLFILLLECGADINAKKSLPLNDRRSELSQWEEKNLSKNTPLHVAAQYSNLRIAKFLLQKGASIDATNKQGNTPFYYAMAYHKYDAARFLLEMGADINATDEDGNTVAHNVAQYPISHLCFSLKEQGENEINSERLAKHFREIDANILFGKKADINVKNKRGYTPLHIAILSSNYEFASDLLEKGADRDAKNNKENTPLHIAIEYQSVPAVQLLLERGADINAQDGNGNTALHNMAYNYSRSPNWIAILKLLLDDNARMDIKNNQGRPPLDCISERVSPHEREKIAELFKQAALRSQMNQSTSSSVTTTSSSANLSTSSNAYIFLPGESSSQEAKAAKHPNPRP